MTKSPLFILVLGLVLGLSSCFQSQAPKQLEPAPVISSQALSSNILADFEPDAPAGFFVFQGASSVVTTPITVPPAGALALPGQTGDNGVLETSFNISDFGGFGQDLNAGLGGPQDWSGFDAIGFWYYGTNSGLTYQAELQDNRSDPANDTAERWDIEFTDSFSGWRFLTFPFATFTRATDFQPGGAPDDGLGLTEVWGWAIILPGGADTVYFDDVQLAQLNTQADFEGGTPPGYFIFNGGGSSVTTPTQVVVDSDALALPGQMGANEILAPSFNVTDFGGFGQDLAAATGGPQDWSSFGGVGFWFYGTNSSLSYQFELQDNRSDPSSDTAERFDYTFADDFNGWRYVTIPFSSFNRATDFQPGGAPDDGLGLTEVWGWAVVLPQGDSSFYLDDVSLLGGEIPLTVGFGAFNYSTEEGTTATVSVALTTAAEQEVRVDYATSDETAVAGSDYAAASGTLVFAPGETQQSFDVETLEDSDEEGPETFTLTLSNPVNVELGANAQTTLTIEDNDFTVPSDADVFDDFEDGLPTGNDGDGVAIGFVTFQDGNSTVSLSTTQAPPAPVPGSSEGNSVLELDLNVSVFAGFIHSFENEAVDTWVTQDWSAYEGLGFWLYGTNSGTDLFVDLVDNRSPGSTVDDAERYSVAFVDNFSGWRYIKLPFADFTRKEIGNGAPNDGLGLTEVHGWAFGTLNTGGSRSYYIDDVGLYGTAPFRPLAVTFSTSRYDIPEGSSSEVTVKLNRAMGDEDPASVSVDYTTEPSYATPDQEYVPVSGTLTFVKGGDTEQSFTIRTFDDTKFEGDERIVLRLSDPQGAEPGIFMQASAFIADNEVYDPDLLDDFERDAFLWDTDGADLEVLELERGDRLARPGQDAYESILKVTPEALPSVEVKGNLCSKGNGVVVVHLLSDDGFDATTVDHNTVRFGGASETHRNKKTNTAKRHEEDVDGDGDTDLVFHFRVREVEGACDGSPALTGQTFDGDAIGKATVYRDFALGQDWSGSSALSFWYYGTGDGGDITVQLKNNRAPDPGPAGWNLIWSDEFNDPAGTPPKPENWTYELGDSTPDGKNGWGNDELQYYTDDPDNAAHDGDGNLVITLREADGSLQCYYGPCEYTSARLISWRKAEFAYGRIESRLLVPSGGDGLWPAFWSLGTDIDYNPWPAAGEIDFMEYVSRLPNEIFGTIHGPGYAGGQSFGGIYDFGGPVYNSYHTFTVEWEPNKITWYVDGIQYHQATPADVAPNEWVFEKPFFLLLNFAIGGNFGGAIDPNNVYPQEYAIDYIRVYAGPDSAERFEATFTDDVRGWQKVTIPFSDFTRSSDQPEGAPDDGLSLNEIWGYGFILNDDATFYLDQVRLQ